METQINCAEVCVNGCVLGDKCPHREHLAAVQKFIQEKSIDEMLQIAANRWNRPPQDQQPPETSHPE